jgi:hypothetical protein
MMRRYNKCYFLLLIGIFNCCSSKHNSNHISLDRPWKFNTGDQMAYAGPFDDTKWASVHLSDSWDRLTNGGYSGFAWYRIKVFIPSSIRKLSHSDSLVIYLGQVADCDQVFINGFIIGENGLNEPETHLTDSSFTNKTTVVKRKYVLSAEDHRIVWDKENLIALRVFVNERRNAFADNPYIGMAVISDGITFNNNVFYQPDQTGRLDTTLILRNATPIAINGNVSIRCVNKVTHLDLFKANTSVTLNPKSCQKLPVSLPYSEDPVKVYLTLEDHRLKIISADSLNLPFILNRQ